MPVWGGVGPDDVNDGEAMMMLREQEEGEHSSSRLRKHHHHHRPIYRRLSAQKDFDLELPPDHPHRGDPRAGPSNGELRIDGMYGVAKANDELRPYGLLTNMGITAEDWQRQSRRKQAAAAGSSESGYPSSSLDRLADNSDRATPSFMSVDGGEAAAEQRAPDVEMPEAHPPDVEVAEEQHPPDVKMVAPPATHGFANVVRSAMANVRALIAPAEPPDASKREDGNLSSRPEGVPEGAPVSESTSPSDAISRPVRTELRLSGPKEASSGGPGTSRAPPGRRGPAGERPLTMSLSRPPGMRLNIPVLVEGADYLRSLGPESLGPNKAAMRSLSPSDDDMSDGEDARPEPDEEERPPEGSSPAADDGADDASTSKVHEVIVSGGRCARVDVRTIGKNPEFELPKDINFAVENVGPKSPWTKGRLLGSGSYGQVFEAVDADGMFFAVKEVSLVEEDKKTKEAISQLMQEIKLLSTFKHKHIVQYLGTERAHGKLYIFLELVTQGSLATIYKRIKLNESQISSYTRQILEGLQFLHARRIVHRDIKCANILVDTRSCKLADFGMAKQISSLDENKSCQGSAYWMAPEVIRVDQTYGPPCDIWSLGCSILEMATGRPPFAECEWVRVLWIVGHGTAPEIPDFLSEVTKDFLKCCLVVNPASRLTATELLQHDFVRKGRFLR